MPFRAVPPRFHTRFLPRLAIFDFRPRRQHLYAADACCF